MRHVPGKPFEPEVFTLEPGPGRVMYHSGADKICAALSPTRELAPLPMHGRIFAAGADFDWLDDYLAGLKIDILVP